jgi:hypothetical protein
MFHRIDDNADFLWHNVVSYAESPPLISSSLAKENSIPRKKAGGFMRFSDKNEDIVAPLLRPEQNEVDKIIYEKTFCVKLDIDPRIRDGES